MEKNEDSVDQIFSFARLEHRQGQYTDADKYYRQARSKAESANGPDDSFVQDVLEKLARLYATTGRYDTERQILERVRRNKEKVFGEHHPATARIVRLLAEHYIREDKSNEAETMSSLAMNIWADFLGAVEQEAPQDLGDFDALYGTRSRLGDTNWIIDRLKQKLKVDRSNTEKYNRAFLISLSEIAGCLYLRRSYSAAVSVFQAALTHLDDAPADVWEHVWIVVALGLILNKQGKHSDAAALVSKYLAILDQSYGSCHDAAPALCNVLGVAMGGQKKFHEASAAFRRALVAQEKNLDPMHVALSDTYMQYAGVCVQVGNLVEAEGFYRRAVRIREEGLGYDHLAVSDTLCALGEMLMAQRKFAEAEPVLQRGAKIIEGRLGPLSERVSPVLDSLAIIYQQQSRLQKAEALRIRSLEIKQLKLLSEHRDLAQAHVDMGQIYFLSGKYVDAENCFIRALTILDKHGKESTRHLARTLAHLGKVESVQSKYPESEQHYRRAVETLEDVLPDDEFEIAGIVIELAELCLKRRKYSESDRLVRRAQKSLSADDPRLESRLMLSNCYLIAGRLAGFSGEAAKARSCYQKAAEFLDHLPPQMAPEVVTLHSRAGICQLDALLIEDAKTSVFRARQVVQKNRLDDDLCFAEVLELSAKINLESGMDDAALSEIKLSLAIREKLQGLDHPACAGVQVLLAHSFCSSGMLDRGEECYHRALQAMEKSLGSKSVELAATLTGLSIICLRRGHASDTSALIKRAISIWERSPMPPRLDLFINITELIPVLRNAEQVQVMHSLIELTVGAVPPLLGAHGVRVISKVLEVARFLIIRDFADSGISMVNRLLDACEGVTGPGFDGSTGDFAEFRRFLQSNATVNGVSSLEARLSRSAFV